MAAGCASIVTRDDAREWRFSVPFGVGAGLTLDEVALLVELDNPYWKSQTLSLIQAGIAGVLAAPLGIRFHIRGTRTALPSSVID